MKSMYRIIFIISISITLVSSSCRKGGKCEQAFNVNQSEIVVTFKDAATGNYLYSQTNPLYNRDSLKVFDPNGNSMVILKALRINSTSYVEYWDLSFGNLYDQSTDANSFNTEICKKYVVKYKYNETDTITVCFKAKKTECGSVFENLNVYHKGQLIGSETNTTGLPVSISKN